MRQDQFERLQALEEKLADVFIVEAEPEKWPGAGIEARSMDQQTRGDRYWCKRNAVATLSLMQRVASLVGQVQNRGSGTTPPAPTGEGEDPSKAIRDEMEAEIQGAEREASKLLAQLQTDAKPKRKAHGRP